MTTVINVPPSLDDATIEQVLDQVAPLPRDQKILIDARHTRWASPYALTTLHSACLDHHWYVHRHASRW